MKNKVMKKGFTLIELIIVIAIIGILAAALIPQFFGAQARARDATRQADINSLVAALETYNADKGEYPTNAAVTGECISGSPEAGDLGAYFPDGLPEPPAGTGEAGPCDGGYFYCQLDGGPANYVIAVAMETDADNALETAIDGLAVCDGTGDAPATLFSDDSGGIFAVVN